MLAPLNSTMIALALPEIQHAFGVSVTATTWLVTLYLAAMAVGQPIVALLGVIANMRIGGRQVSSPPSTSTDG